MQRYGQIHINYNKEKNEETLKKALMIAEVDKNLLARIPERDIKKGIMTPLFWYMLDNYVNNNWGAFKALQSKKIEVAHAPA